MPPIAFLWSELRFVQHYFRETFAESQVPAKARMAPSVFRTRSIYEACLRFLKPVFCSVAPQHPHAGRRAQRYPAQ